MERNLDSTEYELPFSDESDGTRKLIAALPVILLALREGRMVIINELDAKLYPNLLKYVISLFKNREIHKYGAQLLFTSHDMYILKNTVFRRDEIWFVNKRKSGESDIYSLEEYNTRFDQKIDRAYLEGRYGGVPVFNTVFPIEKEGK